MISPSISPGLEIRPISMVDDLALRLEKLEAENRILRGRISDLEAAQEDHERAINENASALNKVWSLQKRSSVPKGHKTIARLETLDQMLKTTGGMTLAAIEKELKISPQEMSRLVSKLDKRRYEIFKRDGSGREKVIKLRARII